MSLGAEENIDRKAQARFARRVVWRYGVPAVVGAGGLAIIFTYGWGQSTLAGLVLGCLAGLQTSFGAVKAALERQP